MQKKILRNNYALPPIMMGTAICDLKGKTKVLQKKVADTIRFVANDNRVGFDTARDYANESLLGDIFHSLISNNIVSRDNIFITTKVGNGQQYSKNMFQELELSLRALRVDYIDLWLLHWPLPEYYIENWKQLCEIYKSGKVKAIGIANCRERHILELEKAGVDILPHVIQIEYHPFRTVPTMIEMCKQRNIQIEAYSANCLMLPFVRNNSTLKSLADKYNKTITQIIMRWHVQQDVIPIFRSMNPLHITENLNVFDFELEEEDMQKIFNLNIDYKFHPESLNCPGY